eukprot:1144208-Pelagomonas_calceolata.AAC.8
MQHPDRKTVGCVWEAGGATQSSFWVIKHQYGPEDQVTVVAKWSVLLPLGRCYESVALIAESVGSPSFPAFQLIKQWPEVFGFSQIPIHAPEPVPLTRVNQKPESQCRNDQADRRRCPVIRNIKKFNT